MKRWLKRLGYCGGAVIALLALFLAIEHFRGKASLNRRLSDLRTKGVVFSVAALEPNRPAPDQNSAMALISLSNRLEVVVSNLNTLPPTRKFVSPGRAIVASRLSEWTVDGKTTNNWQKLGAELENAGELLQEVHEALKKPGYDTGFDYQKGFVDFVLAPVSSFRKTAQLLSVAAGYELSRGRMEMANRHLADLVKLVTVQTPEPLIICQLVRYSCAGTAFNSIWEALQSQGWTEPQLASLQAAWSGCHFGKDMSNACKMELAMDVDMFQQIRASRRKLMSVIEQREQARELSEGLGQSFATHGVILRWVNVPLWRIAWADQDELRTVNSWQEVIERESLAETNSWLALTLATPSPANEPGCYDRFRFLFSTQPFSITDTMIRRTLFIETERIMTVTAIAIQRFRIRSGSLPLELTALVPDYLERLPRDPMDGKTLHYRVLSNESFSLYSVGEDGTDDGGKVTLRSDKKDYRRIWDGIDAVWPVPATDKEAAESMKAVPSE